jgi:nifR3 family TIM-barrel protein
MKLGHIALQHSTVLAPLAGITNLPFRLLVKDVGCGLVCSEMVSANGLVHGSPKTKQLLASCASERPLSAQLFGSDPAIVAKAAEMVQDSGADILDINFGCSVKKIVKTGAGVALMRSPKQAEALLQAVRRAVSIPLTIKIRSGWDATGQQALEISKIAENCGVDAIAVHPRTATQGFRGQSDWSVIAAVKRHVAIPVIGNGDILKPEDAIAMQDQTGCDAIMIGRSAIGNPWIFNQVHALFDGKEAPPVELGQRFEMMITYLHACICFFGETNACRMMRSRLGWYVRGMRYSSHFRESIKKIATAEDALEKIRSYQDALMGAAC